uniref:Serum/glucocorticoid regulated kinase 2a n=1 Tax=Amphilophus citrinellus TaxID=61819 RepID=A0A3Q0QVS3_AMPCI
LQQRSPPSSPSSPHNDVNLGPSANPNARPTDFDFLAVIGKGTFGKVLLAKHKADSKFYAVKVLQKKIILKKKEVGSAVMVSMFLKFLLFYFLLCLMCLKYLAPEILRKEAYDRTVDWWCLGAVLYEMLFSLPPFYSRDVAEMYDGILHKPLPLPPGKSEAASSLLIGLLQKDQHRRLGAIADFLEIKNHTFFSPINWDDLYHKRIAPPYNPNVRGPADTQHIDPEFTREMVPNSVGRTPEFNPGTSSSNAFNGFSFVGTEDGFL